MGVKCREISEMNFVYQQHWCFMNFHSSPSPSSVIVTIFLLSDQVSFLDKSFNIFEFHDEKLMEIWSLRNLRKIPWINWISPTFFFPLKIELIENVRSFRWWQHVPIENQLENELLSNNEKSLQRKYIRKAVKYFPSILFNMKIEKIEKFHFLWMINKKISSVSDSRRNQFPLSLKNIFQFSSFSLLFLFNLLHVVCCWFYSHTNCNSWIFLCRQIFITKLN